MSENEERKETKKGRKKIDKRQLIIRIVALILVLACIMPVIATTILYLGR